MNFYGHLVTASWHSESPDFALGAMLPDFATMAQVSLLPQTGRYSEGVIFHHLGDRVFHRLPEFREQEKWALQFLLEAGLRKGPARAVAHVGVELILDGALVGDSPNDKLYQDALEQAAAHPPAFNDAMATLRFTKLITRLREIGPPIGYRDPSILARTMGKILKPRPLLRLSPEDSAILSDVMAPLHRRVWASSAGIMDAMKAALGS